MKAADYLLALGITVILMLLIVATGNEIGILRSKVTVLQQQSAMLQEQVRSLAEKLDKVEQSRNGQATVKQSRGGERVIKQTMTVTAYNADCCGKSSTHPAYGITASGAKVQEWCTVAAGKDIPFGTKIYIPYFKDKPNGGVFTVQDRGGAIKDNCIDVYIKSTDQCWEFGRQELEVWVLEVGK